jgi:hypothetical protein
MPGPIWIVQNLPRFVSYPVASVEGGAPNEIGPFKVDSGGNLLVNPSPSGNPLPPIPERPNLAVHTFTAIGGATTYDPTPVDIDQVRNWGVWVQNVTATVPITGVRATLYHLTGGGGVSAISQISALPGWVGPNQFLVSSYYPGLWVFNDALISLDNFYRSFKLGVQLAAGVNQQITLSYVGLR